MTIAVKKLFSFLTRHLILETTGLTEWWESVMMKENSTKGVCSLKIHIVICFCVLGVVHATR